MRSSEGLVPQKSQKKLTTRLSKSAFFSKDLSNCRDPYVDLDRLFKLFLTLALFYEQCLKNMFLDFCFVVKQLMQKSYIGNTAGSLAFEIQLQV